jgi:hypothetical protein
MVRARRLFEICIAGERRMNMPARSLRAEREREKRKMRRSSMAGNTVMRMGWQEAEIEGGERLPKREIKPS